jgi:hypothetical protein
MNSSKKLPQHTLEEIKVLYIAWKMGVPIEWRARNEGEEGLWKHHNSFDKYSKHYSLESLALGIEEIETSVCRYRIKGGQN